MTQVLSTTFRPGYCPAITFFYLLGFAFLRVLSILFHLRILTMICLLAFTIPCINICICRLTENNHDRVIPCSVGVLDCLVYFLFI